MYLLRMAAYSAMESWEKSPGSWGSGATAPGSWAVLGLPGGAGAYASLNGSMPGSPAADGSCCSPRISDAVDVAGLRYLYGLA